MPGTVACITGRGKRSGGESLVIATTVVPPTLTPVPTATIPPSGPCACTGNLYNCGDVSTQAQAQSCFNWCMQQVGTDVHRLDSVMGMKSRVKGCHSDGVCTGRRMSIVTEQMVSTQFAHTQAALLL